MANRPEAGASSTGGADARTRCTTIAALNDAFRRTFAGGRLVMTAGVAALSRPEQAAIMRAVATFADFTADNDPHGEHDFGLVEWGSSRFFWKIDCYDRGLEFGSPDPTDPAVTVRVLTIMLADEY